MDAAWSCVSRLRAARRTSRHTAAVAPVVRTETTAGAESLERVMCTSVQPSHGAVRWTGGLCRDAIIAASARSIKVSTVSSRPHWLHPMLIDAPGVASLR